MRVDQARSPPLRVYLSTVVAAAELDSLSHSLGRHVGLQQTIMNEVLLETCTYSSTRRRRPNSPYAGGNANEGRRAAKIMLERDVPKRERHHRAADLDRHSTCAAQQGSMRPSPPTGRSQVASLLRTDQSLDLIVTSPWLAVVNKRLRRCCCSRCWMCAWARWWVLRRSPGRRRSRAARGYGRRSARRRAAARARAEPGRRRRARPHRRWARSRRRSSSSRAASR